MLQFAAMDTFIINFTKIRGIYALSDSSCFFFILLDCGRESQLKIYLC